MDWTNSAKGLRRSWVAALVAVICVVVVLCGLGVAADRAPRLDTERYEGSNRLLAGEALVTFSPHTLSVHKGETATVDVMVTDVVDLFGYELHMLFDPAVIQILDQDATNAGINIAAGDFLMPNYVSPNLADNGVGMIDFTLLQVSPSVSQSGSGTLATITFEAIGPGDADLRFAAVKLSDPDAFEVASLTQDANIIILDATPTDGPSPTPSSTPTATATPNVTQTPGPSPTATQQASPTPYYYLVPDIREIGSGETANVEVRTSHVDGISGVQVQLQWDPAVVQVVDQDPLAAGIQITRGDLFDGYSIFAPPYTVDNVQGRLIYGYAMTEGFCLSGEWLVFTLEFQAVGNGQTPIEFYGDTMMACSGLNLPVGWIDGEIRVVDATSTPSITPTPSSTPTMTSTPEPTPTVVETLPPPVVVCSEVIENGDFESVSSTAWQLTGFAAATSNKAHSPTHSMWLAGYDGAHDGIVQTVDLPASTITATLSCWWYVETVETNPPHDYLYVEIREAGGGAVLLNQTIASDASTTNVWQFTELDLLSLAGQEVDLVIYGETDGAAYTHFFVDDVSLNVCIEQPGATETPSAGMVMLPLVIRNAVW